MKKLGLAGIAAIIVLSGCNTSKKIEAYVQHLYRGRPAPDSTWWAIRCICDMPETFPSAARVTTKKFFESESVRTYTCELNPHVPFEIFSKQCFASATATGLMKTLGSKWIEIHVLSAPAPFKYGVEGVVNIYPIFTKLRYTYIVYDGKSAVQKGEIVLDDNNDAVGDPNGNWKMLTKAYLYRYEYRLKVLTHESIVRLTKEIQKG